MLTAIRLAAPAALLLLLVAPASSADTMTGLIQRYECGDNCYLTIVDPEGTEQTGLCAAPECAAWNENAEMPQRFVGKRVEVTLDVGQLYDAANNAQGEFMAFSELRFLD